MAKLAYFAITLGVLATTTAISGRRPSSGNGTAAVDEKPDWRGRPGVQTGQKKEWRLKTFFHLFRRNFFLGWGGE